ncbi:MAG TPA: class I SAM-dependent methyltransferase [Actinomycetes bacterium]
MLPQPQPDAYYDGFNERLFDAVPPRVSRILEVGCARGRLGQELKRQDPSRYVAGVELDGDAAQVAKERLDDVFVLDVQADIPPIEPGSMDCILFGDVLEHLLNPEDVLRRYRGLLAPDGIVLSSVPNVQHFSVVKNLLRGDFMYQPFGLLDSTHLRFFTAMSFAKLMLDAGFLPRIEDRIRSGQAQQLVERAAPLLTHCRVHPDMALEPLDTFQYIVSGTKLPDAPPGFAATPITFVACVNDEDQLESNLLRSPCLDPGTPHELILMRGQTSAADGFNTAIEKARHHLVVFVQQDIYLPRGWDSRFLEQFRAAEGRFGSVGVAGAFGYTFGPDGKTDLGRVLDRQMLYDMPAPLPAKADGLDEIVLAVRRDTPLRFDPALGFHLYGADLCLSSRRLGLPVAVLDIPCLHNSLFAYLPPAFHASRERLLAKWPDVRPLHSSMGQLDTMEPQPVPGTWVDDLHERVAQLERELATTHGELDSTRAEFDDRLRHIANMEASVFWKLRNLVHNVLRRG